MVHVPLVDLRAEDLVVGAEVRAAVLRVAASQEFILGDEVMRFERRMAERMGVAEAVGVANGSDALVLALAAAGIGPGDEVVTTALSYFATAGAIARVGATPRFADIARDGFNLDPDAVLRVATERTRALLPVHLFGRLAPMPELLAVASERGWTVIEDAAQAIDARHDGTYAGAFGDFGCLSFHPSKNLGAWGDGGMVLCRRAEDAARVRRLRVHGGEGGVHDEVGMNSRLDAVQAAVLGAKLRYLEEFSEARRERARRYRLLFGEAGLDDVVRASDVPLATADVVHHFVVRCEQRDALREHLASRGIGVGVYYPRPLHLQPCFASLGGAPGDCPNAEAACREVLSLPMSPGLSEVAQAHVVDEIRAFYRGRRP